MNILRIGLVVLAFVATQLSFAHAAETMDGTTDPELMTPQELITHSTEYLGDDNIDLASFGFFYFSSVLRLSCDTRIYEWEEGTQLGVTALISKCLPVSRVWLPRDASAFAEAISRVENWTPEYEGYELPDAKRRDLSEAEIRRIVDEEKAGFLSMMKPLVELLKNEAYSKALRITHAHDMGLPVDAEVGQGEIQWNAKVPRSVYDGAIAKGVELESQAGVELFFSELHQTPEEKREIQKKVNEYIQNLRLGED